MPLVEPFHTAEPGYALPQRGYFHDNSDCSEGNKIKVDDRLPGDGGLLRCDRCWELAESEGAEPSDAPVKDALDKEDW